MPTFRIEDTRVASAKKTSSPRRRRIVTGGGAKKTRKRASRRKASVASNSMSLIGDNIPEVDNECDGEAVDTNPIKSHSTGSLASQEESPADKPERRHSAAPLDSLPCGADGDCEQ